MRKYLGDLKRSKTPLTFKLLISHLLEIHISRRVYVASSKWLKTTLTINAQKPPNAYIRRFFYSFILLLTHFSNTPQKIHCLYLIFFSIFCETMERLGDDELIIIAKKVANFGAHHLREFLLTSKNHARICKLPRVCKLN